MTAIIDADAQLEPGDDRLATVPELSKKLPRLSRGLLAIDAIVGDLLRGVPEAQRPPVRESMPPGPLTLFGEEKQAEAERRAELAGKSQFQVVNAAARVKWLDAQGVARLCDARL